MVCRAQIKPKIDLSHSFAWSVAVFHDIELDAEFTQQVSKDLEIYNLVSTSTPNYHFLGLIVEVDSMHG